jgi:DNA-binding response OmpR family regulator
LGCAGRLSAEEIQGGDAWRSDPAERRSYDGFEFADEVRQRDEWRSIPIVVVTAHDSGEERRRLNGYVDTILQKEGDSHEKLLTRVRTLLDDCGASRGITVPEGEAEPAMSA